MPGELVHLSVQHVSGNRRHERWCQYHQQAACCPEQYSADAARLCRPGSVDLNVIPPYSIYQFRVYRKAPGRVDNSQNNQQGLHVSNFPLEESAKAQRKKAVVGKTE